jgi:hypothetical protein
MRVILFFTFLQACFAVVTGQDKKPAIVVNTQDDVEAQLANNIFRYKNYTAGKVLLKDNSAVEAKMNYDQLTGKMLFINPKGDTLEFANPETFNMVIVGKDSFYVFETNYLEKITHYTGINLAVIQTLKYLGSEKKGAFGTYSNVSGVTSNSTYTSDEHITTSLGVDERGIYRFNNTYFISDRFNNFFPANRKNFYKAFFAHEKQIGNFCELHHINFSKKEDLERLLDFARSLDGE